MEFGRDSLYKPWRHWMAPVAIAAISVAAAETRRRIFGVPKGLAKRIGADAVGAVIAFGVAEAVFNKFQLGYKTEEDWASRAKIPGLGVTMQELEEASRQVEAERIPTELPDMPLWRDEP